MPQLDVNVYPSQLFWLIIVFGILYLCMHCLIVPRVSKIFQKRRHLLEEKLEEIDHFREEIEQLERKIELLSAKSQQDSTELLRKTQKEYNKIFEEEELKIQKKFSEALKIFNNKTDLTLQGIEKELSKQKKEFSTLILQQILETSPNNSQKKEEL